MFKPVLPPEGLTEQQEDALPMLVQILDKTGPHNLGLFIGNKAAANDGILLQEANITSTMNIAVNLYLPPLDLPNGTAIRRTHIGLIDGHGNHASHLAAAVLALHGILDQDSPGKPHYPPHKRGHILVNCRGGRSRSLSVLALYLYWAHPDQFFSLEAAMQHIRQLRGLSNEFPLPGMIKLAHQAYNLLPDYNSLAKCD